ncbi:hypothetical protein [Microbacterium sp. W4I20]|uniref:hypothetical protein n=1 Tax=Microbacterium sp. W4I20 TaxID=3042262 RepID=UPI0027D8127D|nr:hypothetical protein [Microbacterium sp. W4I20]
MKLHRLASLPLVAIAVGSVVLTGCSPTSDPTPTPTPAFASEEEAFAAAEETYRAYTDATNATDLGEPKTFEPVFALLTDQAQSAARKNFSEYHANGIRRTGKSSFDTFTPVEFTEATVTVRLCIDVSDVDLVGVDGVSVVPPDRTARQSIEVEFVRAETETGLGISSSVPTEGIAC